MRIGGVKHCTPYSNVFHYLSTLSNILAIFITSLLALIFFEGKESMWKRHEYRCSDDANLNCFFGYFCCTSGMYLRWFWIYWCAIPPYFLAGDSGGTPWPLWRRLTRDVFLTSSVPGNVQSSVFFPRSDSGLIWVVKIGHCFRDGVRLLFRWSAIETLIYLRQMSAF
jgi:hypothetical protein